MYLYKIEVRVEISLLLRQRFVNSVAVAGTEQTTLWCWLESGDNGVDVLFPNMQN